MCVSRGAPKKPEYGPCQERHQGQITYYIYPNTTSTADDTSNTGYWSPSTTSDTSNYTYAP